MTPGRWSVLRYGLAAGAVLVALAVGGVYLLPRITNPGGAPLPPDARLLEPMGNRLQPLAPGTWYLDSPMPARVYFTVPDDYSAWGYGWGSPAVDIMSPGGASLQIMAVGRVFADPCDPAQGETDPPSGSTPDELLTALASVGELELTAPSDVMVDGYTARHVVLTVRETDNPCREVQLWSVGNRSVSMRPGEQSIVWAVDVDGTRIVLFGDLEHPALAEVIASIRINP